MSIPWADLGTVLLVGLVLGAGVVVLYAIGVRVLSPAGPDGESPGRAGPIRTAITTLCFLVCAAAVAYGIFTLL